VTQEQEKVLKSASAKMTISSDEAPLLDSAAAADRTKAVFWKVLSAVMYGVASFMITVINKTVLTTYS
jgi:hypothetical protein